MTNPLPREMVLASAGSGKTYHISSRLIGLLALGESPGAVWASTFTRKAAGEILDRVLLRLARGALDEAQAREVARSAWFGEGDPPPGFLDQGECARLLKALAAALHRANISTLDSFFVRVATTFAEELGLAPGWTLLDGSAEERICTEALETVLDRERAPVMAELIRTLARGEAGRGVHRRLLGQVEKLLEVHRQVDPALEGIWVPDLPGVPLSGPTPLDGLRHRRTEIAHTLLEMPLPTTKAGAPKKVWENAMAKGSQALLKEDWVGLFSGGPFKKMVETGELVPGAEVVFSGDAPGEDLAALMDECAWLARVGLGGEIRRQGQALETLAGRYREAFEGAQALQGGYRFQDLTHLLGEAAVLGLTEALFFRLDARIRHILLDEFQDTSLPQWDVLEPLVSELLAGEEETRSAVVVADPKQSIYGWRGARPGLAAEVRSRYGLRGRALEKSWRSGPDVLDTVADVFRGLEGNPVVQDLPGGPAVAAAWLEDFFPQRPADPHQPGLVRLLAGPPLEGRNTVQPRLLDAAAELVAELATREPGATVGVLVRTNRVVSYLIAALRQRGVAVSGEGGTPLTDAAPVNALLALLRMADHPGDRLARYHVARTPVGEMVGMADHQDAGAAASLARRIRRTLLREGYGKVLGRWARGLDPSCDPRERARLKQLVELGFRWDRERTLRPREFVTWVESERVEDPSAARVRVMTVHQAKGLQFDTVVLPQLGDSLEPRSGTAPVVPLRDETTGRVVRVDPATNRVTRALLPELLEAHLQSRALSLRDELSNLYVAMTRAAHALHLVVPGDGEGGQSSARSPARLLRAALAPGVEARDGAVLFQRGDPEWAAGLPQGEARAGSPTGVPVGAWAPVAGPIPVKLKEAGGPRSRNLAHRSPSSLEGGGMVDPAAHLRMDLRGEARLRGAVVHAWCEMIEWLQPGAPDVGLPDEEALLAAARREAPGKAAGTLEAWLSDFRVWMAKPAIAGALALEAYARPGPPAEASPRKVLHLERELPFLHRTPSGILQGYVDRLVVVEVGGRPAVAQVLDFKTDQLDASDPEALQARVEYYRHQIRAYREAVAARYGLAPDAVGGRLLFLRAGVVVDL